MKTKIKPSKRSRKETNFKGQITVYDILKNGYRNKNMYKYTVLLTFKKKQQVNTIVLSSRNAEIRAIELFKNLYKLSNDTRSNWDYFILDNERVV